MRIASAAVICLIGISSAVYSQTRLRHTSTVSKYIVETKWPPGSAAECVSEQLKTGVNLEQATQVCSVKIENEDRLSSTGALGRSAMLGVGGIPTATCVTVPDRRGGNTPRSDKSATTPTDKKEDVKDDKKEDAKEDKKEDKKEDAKEDKKDQEKEKEQKKEKERLDALQKQHDDAVKAAVEAYEEHRQAEIDGKPLHEIIRLEVVLRQKTSEMLQAAKRLGQVKADYKDTYDRQPRQQRDPEAKSECAVIQEFIDKCDRSLWRASECARMLDKMGQCADRTVAYIDPNSSGSCKPADPSKDQVIAILELRCKNLVLGEDGEHPCTRNERDVSGAGARVVDRCRPSETEYVNPDQPKCPTDVEKYISLLLTRPSLDSIHKLLEGPRPPISGPKTLPR